MPALEIVGLVHTAVLYVKTGTDEQVEETFATPVQIKCRWTDDFSETQNPTSKVQSYDGKVATAIDLVIGSVIVKGTLKSGVVTRDSEIMQIIRAHTRDDIKGKPIFKRREYDMVRWKGTLPS